MMRVVLACLLLAAAAPALAGRFSVAPIRVDFGAGLRIGAVTVTSEDDHPLVFKNTPSLWTQNADGGDVYTPTSDLVVTPPLLRVETGEPRIVRIGTLRDPGEVERTVAVLVRLPGGTGRIQGDYAKPQQTPLEGSPEEMADVLRAYASEGIGHVQLVMDPITRGSIEAFAPVLARLDA